MRKVLALSTFLAVAAPLPTEEALTPRQAVHLVNNYQSRLIPRQTDESAQADLVESIAEGPDATLEEYRRMAAESSPETRQAELAQRVAQTKQQITGAVRFRPMMLTAAAVIVGSAVIVFDPIFQGLAIASMAGETASQALSRVTAPVVYFPGKSLP